MVALGKCLNNDTSTLPKVSSPSTYSDAVLLIIPVTADDLRISSRSIRTNIHPPVIQAAHLKILLVVLVFFVASISTYKYTNLLLSMCKHFCCISILDGLNLRNKI